MQKCSLAHLDDYRDFIEYLNDMFDIYELIDEYNRHKKWKYWLYLMMWLLICSEIFRTWRGSSFLGVGGGQYFCRGLLLLSLVLLLLQSMFLTFFLLILFFWFWILFLLNLIKWSFSCKTSTKQQAYDFSGFYQNSIFSWKKKNFQNFHCWDFVNMQKLGGVGDGRKVEM